MAMFEAMAENAPSLMHKGFVTALLASARFHSGPHGLDQITLKLPIAIDTIHGHYMMLLVNPNTMQIVVDVYQNNIVQYSGITAADMSEPMCPVFKH